MNIRQNESLASRNTLALQAQCKALVEIFDDSTLYEALSWARGKQLPVVVLGEGSNVVLAGNVDALVVQQLSRGIEVLEETHQNVLVRAAAGESWHSFVDWSLTQGYFGLENLALIPGTVGAAPIQNIGAYGVELESFVHSVSAIRIEDRKPVTLAANECGFSYRDSIFKQALRDKLVINAVEFRLSKLAKPQLSYPVLAAAVEGLGADQLSPRDIFNIVVSIRKEKLPAPGLLPNVGSFFKNPVLAIEHAALIQSRFPDCPTYPAGAGKLKFPAAWLIDSCGWKGHRDQGVGVHEEHALVLVNYGANSGSVLLGLAERIADSVSQKFGIKLEVEPRIYGVSCE